MNRKKLEEIVARLGAIIDQQDDDSHFLNIDAPTGFTWNANGSHTIAVQFENAVGQRWTREAFKEAANDMNAGISRCEDPECDFCAERREFDRRFAALKIGRPE